MPKNSCAIRSTSTRPISCPSHSLCRNLPKPRSGRSRPNKACPRILGDYAFAEMIVPRSILIVEDEPLIAMMLEDFLESLGHSVAGTCDSVECALKKVENGGFDLAILDVNLKGETVWPVASRLRERNVPFVIATGGHGEHPPPAVNNAPANYQPHM